MDLQTSKERTAKLKGLKKISDQMIEINQSRKEEIKEYKNRYYNEQPAEKRARYYQENRDERSNYDKQYYQENRDKHAQYNKQYYIDNRDEIVKNKADHYNKHRDEILYRKRRFFLNDQFLIFIRMKYLQQDARNRTHKLAMDYMKADYERLGPLSVLCMHCGHPHFPEERVQNNYGEDSFYSCCAHGKIKLDDEDIPRG